MAVLYKDAERAYRYVYYVAPMMLMAPLFLVARIRESKQLPIYGLILDVMVIAIAASRLLTVATPFSGHMVIASYVVFSCRSKLLLGFALAILLQTTWLKLVYWGGFSNWGVGLLLGSSLAVVRIALVKGVERRWRLI